MHFWTLFLYTFNAMIYAVLQPFFWIIVLFLYFQYKKTAAMQLKLYGAVLYPLKNQMVDAISYGFLISLICSYIMVLIGVTIDSTGLLYIWIIALLLMLVNPRYLCFSYAGGLISLYSLITGNLKIDVTGIMALVAILHLMESLLIWIDGYKSRLPIFIKKDDGSIIGGFSMQRFWPIPFVVLTAISAAANTGMASYLSMPDWWPLLKSNIGPTISLSILPGIAALGYGDITLTQTPEKHVRDCALLLFGFSVSLLIISIVSSKIYLFKWIAALYAPIVHELILNYGEKKEKTGPPAFKPPDKGVKVLDVFEGTPGYQMGLKQGDTITKINNIEITDEIDMQNVINKRPSVIWVDAVDIYGNKKVLEYKDYKYGVYNLGFIFVPKDPNITFELNKFQSPFIDIIKFIKKKIKK